MTLKLYPDEILRKRAQELSGEDIQQLYNELVGAMHVYNGIGLAAPQIGILKRIAVISENASPDMEKPLLIVNPVYTDQQGKQSMEEACLSVKDVSAYVPRFDLISLETGLPGNRQRITVTGLLSIVIQHEIDHLDGILFPDRLFLPKKIWSFMKAKKNKKYLRYI